MKEIKKAEKAVDLIKKKTKFTLATKKTTKCVLFVIIINQDDILHLFKT